MFPAGAWRMAALFPAAVQCTFPMEVLRAASLLMLRAPFNDSTGWGNFEYAVIPITGGTSVAITDADFPLGYVTVSGGTAVVSIESFTPPMAVFIKAGTCSG